LRSGLRHLRACNHQRPTIKAAKHAASDDIREMVMQLDLGSHVKTKDGQDIGKVDRIVFEPESMTVREFVVHEGVLFTHDRIVGRALVDHIDGANTVHLRLNAEEAQDLPAFFAEQHEAIYTGDLYHAQRPMVLITPGSVPRDAVVLSHRSQVYDRTGKHIGHLDEIVYRPDGVATAFIVDSGILFTHDLRVPVLGIKSVRHGRIDLSIESSDAMAAARTSRT
jgi:uncharacterized protein YrrD